MRLKIRENLRRANLTQNLLKRSQKNKMNKPSHELKYMTVIQIYWFL